MCNKQELFVKTVNISSKILPDMEKEIVAMAGRYRPKWKEIMDSEMAYTLVAGSDRTSEENSSKATKKNENKLSITHIAGKVDILSDLETSDVKDVKAVISLYANQSDNDRKFKDAHKKTKDNDLPSSDDKN